MGCGPVDPEHPEEEDVTFEDADSQNDDGDAQKEMERLFKACQPAPKAVENEPTTDTAADSPSKVDRLEKLMEKMAITVERLAARDKTTSVAGSNAQQDAGSNAKHHDDPAGNNDVEPKGPELVNIYDEEEKKDEVKAAQTNSEPPKPEEVIEKLVQRQGKL